MTGVNFITLQVTSGCGWLSRVRMLCCIIGDITATKMATLWDPGTKEESSWSSIWT